VKATLPRVVVAAAGLALAALSGGVVQLSEARLERSWATPEAQVAVPGDAAAIERGRHIGEAIAQCTFCHGDDLSGRRLADDPWIGRIWGPNLTSGVGGLPRDYRDEDLVRVIRHGVTRSGRSVRLMPSEHLRAMSDADLGALIAWLRSVPPVDATPPEAQAGPATRLALVAGLAPELLAAERIDHAAPPPPAPPPGATAEYGAYLVGIGICRVCHHDGLEGGLHPLALPGEPPPSDLRASGPLAAWSGDEFVTAMRSGTTPEGRRLDARYMPWPRYAQMSDVELRAIWAYLRTLR
jgi:mono/diheme cytochrome c family protein